VEADYLRQDQSVIYIDNKMVLPQTVISLSDRVSRAVKMPDSRG